MGWDSPCGLYLFSLEPKRAASETDNWLQACKMANSEGLHIIDIWDRTIGYIQP